MCRAAFASLTRPYWTIAGLAALSFLPISHAQAEQGPGSCKLLQVTEIESALGGKASTKLAGSTTKGSGMDMDECSMQVSGPGPNDYRTVSIRILSDLPMDPGDAVRMRNAGTAREGQWKVAGARLEQKTVGNAMCILTGRPSVAGHSICTIPRARGYVEVDVTASLPNLLSIDPVLSLVQKAIARL